MRYMGSKNRIAKHILPIILENRKENQCYVEPFVGGANLIDKVDGWRIGADNNFFLIAFWKKFVTGWEPPKEFTEEEYHQVKDNKYKDPTLTGFVGFSLSYGGKWFGGWSRDKQGSDYVGRAYRHLIKQRKGVVGVQFVYSDYKSLRLPKNSLVYCDPPYKNTTKYKTGFNHEHFWFWVKELKDKGHIVFVSEYEAPEFCECVWKKEQVSSLTKDTGSKKAVEKLFVVK